VTITTKVVISILHNSDEVWRGVLDITLGNNDFDPSHQWRGVLDITLGYNMTDT
jgi:hypothetical protein